MPKNQINLADLLGAATSVLAQNQGALNQADAYNQNHGDNMVQIFNLINQAIGEKPKAKPAEQLAYASQMVKSQTQSGSAKVYSNALQTAAEQFQGQKSLNTNNALELITTLLGGGQTAQTTLSKSTASGGADLLTSLLGGLGTAASQGTATTQGQKAGQLDAQDLLRGGMAYMAAQQRGASGAEALLDAVISGSPLSETPQRAQSAKLIGTAFLSAVSAYATAQQKKAAAGTR